MRNKILYTSMIAFFLCTPVWSCSYKVFDLESDALQSKLSSHIPVTQEMIADALHFIYDLDKVDENYKRPDSFESLYLSLQQEVDDPYFLDFFKKCSEFYNSYDSDLKTKTSLHLLVDRVSNKYFKIAKLMTRQRKFLEEERLGAPGTTQADADRVFQSFLQTEQGCRVTHLRLL